MLELLLWKLNCLKRRLTLYPLPHGRGLTVQNNKFMYRLQHLLDYEQYGDLERLLYCSSLSEEYTWDLLDFLCNILTDKEQQIADLTNEVEELESERDHLQEQIDNVERIVCN